MHLIAGDLALADRQLSLFGSAPSKLDRIKASVNRKLGRFLVRSGTTLFLPYIYADQANDFDICDVHGKTCF